MTMEHQELGNEVATPSRRALLKALWMTPILLHMGTLNAFATVMSYENGCGGGGHGGGGGGGCGGGGCDGHGGGGGGGGGCGGDH